MTALLPALQLGPLLWWIVGAAVILGLLPPILLLTVFLRWGRQGKAMVRTGVGARRVETGRILVVPGLHELHWVDLTLKRVELMLRGNEALAASDGEPVELRACFVLRLPSGSESVLAACDHFGMDRAGDEAAVQQAYSPACRAALTRTLGQYTQADLYSLEHQEQIRTQIADQLAGELTHGYVLDSVAVEYFEPVTPEQLADRDETG